MAPTSIWMKNPGQRRRARERNIRLENITATDASSAAVGAAPKMMPALKPVSPAASVVTHRGQIRPRPGTRNRVSACSSEVCLVRYCWASSTVAVYVPKS